MDKAIKMSFIKNQLEQINAVREWYNVMWMSEICTFDGLSIRPGVMFGHEEDVPYTRRSSGPKQDLPNSYSWKFWRKVLSSFTEEDDGAELKRPLGDWTSSHSKYGI